MKAPPRRWLHPSPAGEGSGERAATVPLGEAAPRRYSGTASSAGMAASTSTA